ncbi:MAG: hypothetical protein NTX53_11095, partial [candidate division WOR-3 bacterium]|nr:hypothetical protein [candidate division WOR-3 bacterium]
APAAYHDDGPVELFPRYQVAGVFGRGHGQRIPVGRAESRRTRGGGDGRRRRRRVACLPRSAWRRQAGFGLASVGMSGAGKEKE